MNGTIDLDDASAPPSVWCILVTSGYTVDATVHTLLTHASGSEVSGTGYTAGGAEITSLAITSDLTNNLGKWDGADVTWATSTITARGAVVYISTTEAATRHLVCWVDFGSDKSSSAGNFTIQWSTSGIINLT